MNFCPPTSVNGQRLPTIDDVREAAQRIKGKTTVTPLLEAPLLNERLGARLLVKPECLQKTGSFKYRGATNSIACLNDGQRKKGVVAFSSGNHAQGVAAAAREADIPAVIIMPKDAPAIKIANTRAYGAEVILYDRYSEDREEIGIRISEERGSTLIKPYDALPTIAGQGTIGLEIADQCRDLGVTPSKVLIPCGGGGLVAGTALALNSEMPNAAVYAVEPEDFDDTARSLKSGTREGNAPSARSYCDALLSPMPGEMTFPINQQLLAGGLSVSDEDVAHAMKVAFNDLKVVVEPGGSVALAALLSGKVDIQGETVVAVLSGGNVDSELYRRILAE